VHFRRRFFDGWYLSNHYVTVHVVDPLIGSSMRDGDDLPHIYWNDRAPDWPALCLWDPEEIFWDPEMSIATTVIPWTSEWLLFFEYWQISGEFLGPGRHPRRRRNTCPKPLETSDPATALEGSDSATLWLVNTSSGSPGTGVNPCLERDNREFGLHLMVICSSSISLRSRWARKVALTSPDPSI